MIAVLPIAWGLWEHGSSLERPHNWVTVLIVVALATDALDGWMARSKGLSTEMGKVLDPVADKLLLLSLFGMALIWGKIPWILMGLMLLRDVLIVLIGLRMKVKTGVTPPARFLGKVTAIMLILTWIVVYYAPTQALLHESAMIATVLFLVLSSIDYGRYAYRTLSKT